MKWISTKGRYQRKHKPVCNWIPILILLAVFSVGAIMAVRGILRDQNRQEKYDFISESVHAEESSTADYIPAIPVIPADTTRDPAEIETEPEILTQYASVYEQNPDLFGWICIENTVLDYTVSIPRTIRKNTCACPLRAKSALPVRLLWTQNVKLTVITISSTGTT